MKGQLQLTHHITLHAVKIAQIPTETTLQQVRESPDAKYREKTVNRSKAIKGYMRLVGLNGFQAFDFSISNAGVEA